MPFHHAALPATRTDERLFSSLWLYLAGVSPVLFGVRAADSGFRFLISGVLGRFHAVGTSSSATPRRSDRWRSTPATAAVASARCLR